MVRWIVVGLALLLPLAAFAQEHEGEAHEEFKRSKLTATFGYTHIPEGTGHDESDEEGYFLPTAGLDYFYRLSEKWSLGAMFDIEFGEYLIIDKDLSRSNAMIFVAVLGYELMPSWGLIAGGGIEIEESENLSVVRVGTEYQLRPGGNWVVAPGLIFDIKQEYTSWSLVLGAGMEF